MDSYLKTRLIGALVMALEKRYPRWLVSRIPVCEIVDDVEGIINREAQIHEQNIRFTRAHGDILRQWSGFVASQRR